MKKSYNFFGGIFVLALVLAGVMFICNLQFSFANDSSQEKKQVIKVGYSKNYGMVDNPDSLDNIGFGYEVLTRAEHYSNYEFEFIEYEYWEALEALQKGQIDLMGIMLESEIYAQNYTFVPKVLGTTQLILATEKENIYYDDPSAIDGKVVASFHNNPYEKYLNEYCDENDISIKYVRGGNNDYTELDADFFLVTTIDKNASHLNMVMNLKVFDMHFLTNKDDEQLAANIAEAIELSISADGTFLEELQIEYFGSKNLTRRFLTREESELLQSKKLTCGYIDHHQPIQFTDDEGNADGVSVDVMKKLTKEHNFEIEYFPYNHSMPEKSHEDFDMLISVTGELEHELEHYIPTENFLELPIMLFSNEENLEKILGIDEEATIGILNYITIDKEDIESRYPNTEIIFYDTFDEVVEAYKQGEIHGIFSTDMGAEYAKVVLNTNDYTITSTSLVLPLRVFLSKDLENLTEYLGAFNIMFEHINKNSLDGILSTQYANFLPEYSFIKFIKENMHLLIILVLIIMFIISAMVLYLQLRKKKAILNLINNDTVTNLISPYHFNEKAAEILKPAKPNDYEIISIDLDNFHTINTIYNQEKGDKVINALADALANCYKEKDELVTRVIADQFLVLHKHGNKEDIENICKNHIYPAIKEIMGEKYDVSISVGLCTIENPNQPVNEIIDFAVVAMQNGKHKHGFTKCEYCGEIKQEHELKTSIVYKMKDELEAGNFFLLYQPKINFKTLKIEGAEALVRWKLEVEQEVLPPALFIDIFESNGFIVNLDMYVFEEACKFIVEQGKKTKVPLISVNLSSITLFHESFPRDYLKILEKYGLSTDKIEIEITESAITLEEKLLIEKVEDIKREGMQISIDDFGAGESSLNRLSKMNVNTVKLDKAFLESNILDQRGSVVVETVIKLAKELDMKVVSEGVETLEQAKWLKKVGCDLAQGYFFERPLSEEDFVIRLKEDKKYKL